MSVFSELHQIIMPDTQKKHDTHHLKNDSKISEAENNILTTVTASVTAIQDQLTRQDETVAEHTAKVDVYLSKFDSHIDSVSELMDKFDSCLNSDNNIAAEKLDMALSNFPKLEENIVRRINTSNKSQADELRKDIGELIEAERRNNVFTRCMLTISFILNIAVASGVVALLLYHMDIIAL